MSKVEITDAEHQKIVEMHINGKNHYDIAKAVFKFENEETVDAVANEVAKAEEAGEFVAKEDKKKATK